MSALSTPRPWRATSCAYVRGPDVVVATCGDWKDKELLPFNRDRWEADAELIVRAVNAHDELVAALEQMRSWRIPGMDWTDATGQALLAQADTALAKARGEQ